ncbi:TolC family protein [Puniceicoccus vermicola]|uniref:TolC family protein n=1 Tax=Puniceicoccus vermicola TaxID=388746 RepID=A0A7X1B353_9BACT|nr:TolC family protein [Puniceicoccus vermicola]MBC2603555.1 TolC family protein [Puniceicoccus vermicola]
MSSRKFMGNAALVFAGIFFLSGCASVDEWSVFEPDYSEKLAKETDREKPVETEEWIAPENLPTKVVRDGEEVYEVSVEEAVFLALQNNPELRVQTLNPVIAGAFVQIERGVFDPELYALFEYQEENLIEASRSTEEEFSVDGSSRAAEVGIRQRLPTGTDLELAAVQEQSVSNRTPEQNEARLGLTVTQSLLKGFGPVVNLASIQLAEWDSLISQYELWGYGEALIADVEIAYWRWVLARREIAIFEQSFAVAELQRDEIEQRIELGALPENDAAAVRAEVALRRRDLIDAQSALEESRLRLARMILPDGFVLQGGDVLPTSEPQLEEPPPLENIDERIQLALESRPDLREAELRLDQARLETIVSRNGLLPRLDFFLSLGKTGYASSFSDSFRNLDGDTYDWSIGGEFSYPLGNRAGRGEQLAARATRDQALQSIRNLRRVIRTDVLLAANELERTRRQIGATAATVELQRQSVEAEKERLEVGIGTSLQLSQVQRDLLEAEIERVRAIVQYRIAQVELYLAEGSLLERRGIVLSPRFGAGR